MKTFTEQSERILRDTFEDCTLYIFGHVGDSNLHLLVSADTEEEKDSIYDIVYELSGLAGGTITAEHGIGTSKNRWLHLCRNRQEIELMRLLKKTLDPAGILNRHRVLD